MNKSIEDSHIARTIAEQIEEEEGEFEHYATVKVDNKSGHDDWDYKWRTFHIGLRRGDIYIAERSSTPENVHVHDATEIGEALSEIASRAHHYWENVSVETSALFADLAAGEVEVPDLFLDSVVA